MIRSYSFRKSTCTVLTNRFARSCDFRHKVSWRAGAVQIHPSIDRPDKISLEHTRVRHAKLCMEDVARPIGYSATFWILNRPKGANDFSPRLGLDL